MKQAWDFTFVGVTFAKLKAGVSVGFIVADCAAFSLLLNYLCEFIVIINSYLFFNFKMINLILVTFNILFLIVY